MKYMFPGSTLRALALISFSIFSPYTAFPQNFATLSGTVSDKTGAAVAAARVVAQNLDTLVSRETNSDDSGLYTLPLLQPGRYKVSVQKAGSMA